MKPKEEVAEKLLRIGFLHTRGVETVASGIGAGNGVWVQVP